MKTKEKLYSLITMLFLGLALGFASCSSDDDDDSSASSYELGKAAGVKFIQEYEAYQAAEGLEAKTTKALPLYNSYVEYKAKKNDKQWQSGFLAGAAKEDASKYDTLSEIMETDFNSVAEIATLVTKLSNFFSGKSE